MIEWLTSNAGVLQVATSAVTAMVWVVYLQTFLSGYRRQQRPMILVTSGAGRGLNGHCLVTNLGLEPVSILSIILDVSDGQNTARAIIPDRNEMMTEEGSEDASATNQGPMIAGTMRDLGRFSALLNRASQENPEVGNLGDATSVEVTIVAATASTLTGASRCFIRQEGSGTCRFKATRMETKQHSSRKDRRRLHEILQADLA